MGGADHALIIWDLDTGFERALNGHQAEIRSVAFDPRRELIASGDKDSTVRVWDLAAGQEIRLLDDLKGMVTGVSFSGDGRLLAAASSGITPILVWDVASLLPISFEVYGNLKNPWLELDESTHGIRWNASTNRLDHAIPYDFVNLTPASHIGILQRDDFDPTNPVINAALKNKALFGQFLYARNWASALAIYEQMKTNGNPAAQRARETLLKQLQAESKKNPASSAAPVLKDLQGE